MGQVGGPGRSLLWFLPRFLAPVGEVLSGLRVSTAVDTRSARRVLYVFSSYLSYFCFISGVEAPKSVVLLVVTAIYIYIFIVEIVVVRAGVPKPRGVSVTKGSAGFPRNTALFSISFVS